MMELLAARLDRSGRILVNTRLDHYPAFFHIIPEAIDAALQLTPQNPVHSLALLEQHWRQLEPTLQRLVRRHGQDFEIDARMLQS
jgi:hypothetical protein